MRFITIRELRTKSAEIWRSLPGERELVVTHNGKPIAILTPTTDRQLEQSLRELRRARSQQAVASLQANSARLGKDRLSPADIDTEIAAVRKARKARKR